MIKPPAAAAVTVEVFAEWAHRTIGDELRGTGVDTLSVRVYENADAFGGFAGPTRLTRRPCAARHAADARLARTAISGGFLYHRRMAEAAASPRRDRSRSARSRRRGRPGDADVVVIDSIAAWRMLPSLLVRRQRGSRSSRSSTSIPAASTCRRRGTASRGGSIGSCTGAAMS